MSLLSQLGSGTVPWIALGPFQFNMIGLFVVPPDALGVYGMVRMNGLDSSYHRVKIGRGIVRERLEAHMSDPVILAQRPTHFFFELTPNDVQREKDLIRAYPTELNERIG